MIQRKLKNYITDRLFKGKAIIVLGARQTGKTTLLKTIETERSEKSLWLDCDEIDIRTKLNDANSQKLKNLIGNAKLVFIDEAQRVENIGITLKLITDNLKDVQLVVSGSSALEISNKINEPLTGRKYETVLFPISTAELIETNSTLSEERLLENRLIYGLYPDIVMNPGNEIELLKNLTNSYLYKDILFYKDIRKPQVLQKLLQLLALQIGSEVSYNELANSLQVDKETVERYIDLLEKSFIVFRLGSFSRNQRNEINKGKKIYFYDNGIRNALISNFNSLSLRNDTGALWENFLITERTKQNAYNLHFCNSYFWRTTQQQEIDYIEEHSGKLFCYEFKWNENKKAKLSTTFSKAYPEHEFEVIHRNNFIEFLTIHEKNP